MQTTMLEAPTTVTTLATATAPDSTETMLAMHTDNNADN